MPPELEAARPTTAGEEELQLQLALAMSKEEHDEDERKKKTDDVKLQMALEESKRDEVWLMVIGGLDQTCYYVPLCITVLRLTY